MKKPVFWNIHASILTVVSCAILAGVALLLTNYEAMIDKTNFTGAVLLGVERNKLPHRRFTPYLKYEVNELLGKSGLPPRYPSAEPDDRKHPDV